MPASASDALLRAPIAGLLAWLVPGLGHWYAGQRGRGLVCMVTITATFWTGVAIGGVRETVDPAQRRLWFLAQLGAGGNALAAYGVQRVTAAVQRGKVPAAPTPWRALDMAIHYTAVAGLLNLLVVLDAIARAETPIRRRMGFTDAGGGGP